MAKQPPRPASRSTTARVLGLLDAFGRGDSLTLTEISRRTGLPLTTTHRFVGELTAFGALERDEAGLLHVGLRLWEIASRAPRSVGLREAAMPFLEDLYEATHENVQLAVRDDIDVVYIERITGSRAVGVLTRVGLRFPMHASGVGLVLLAFAERAVQERVLAGPLKAFTEMTIVDSGTLRQVLAEVRRSGVAVSDRQVTMDSVSVAAPIRDAHDGVVAAISLVVASDTAQPLALAPAVVAAARGVSRVLRSSGLPVTPPR